MSGLRVSPLARVALGARSQSRLFMLSLAKTLKEAHGSEIHLYCSTPQEAAYYRDRNSDGVLTTINVSRGDYENLFDADLDSMSVFNRARAYEDRLGITINRLIVPDRHLGRGYALGGYYHPRSRYSENSTYTQAVHAICERLSYWEKEFRDKGITLCLNGSREAAAISRLLRVPYRALARSRIRNLHFWSHNELYETPEFEAAWRGSSEFPPVTLDRPYDSHLASRAKYLDAFGVRTLVRDAAIMCAKQVYWRLKGYQKARGYFLTENLQLQYRIWRESRRLAKIATTRLKDLEGQRFVYFPLHVEPETALHGLSPEYFYQHALIAAVSRDLPAGVILAVKEAYGVIGRRPDTFYDQIRDLKNVVFLDTWEMGIACVQAADAVVTICGTAGLEAVASGTPVISFGRHNLYNFLPSVKVVEDETDLAGYLADALSGRVPRADVKREGSRLLGAIAACSFDMLNYNYIDVDRFEDAAVENAAAALAGSLAESGGASRIRATVAGTL